MPRLALIGFYVLLIFVFITIPGIYAKIHYGQEFFLCGSGKSPQKSPTSESASSPLPPPPSPQGVVSFAPPTSIPSGTTIRINGSTSMVQINQALKAALTTKFQS